MLRTKQRIAWVDVAKAIAILLIVLGHTLRGGVIRNILYSFHVVTFFLLSGMTCKANEISKRIKNDFLRILVPYYGFGLVSILFFAVLGKFAADQLGKLVDTSVWYNILGLLYACPMVNPMKFNMPLWFLPCLFATKMLYYILYKLCRGKQIRVLFCSIGLCAVGFLYTGFGGPGLPFNLALSFKMLAFFCLGRIIYVYAIEAKPQMSISRYKALAIGAGLLGLTAVAAWLMPNSIDYSRDVIPNILSFFLTSCAGSFAVCLIAVGIDSNRAVEYIGKHSLAIVVMHKFPVLLFQTVGPQKALLTQYDSFACIVISIAIALISVGLCLGVEVVIRRFCPFLFGSFKKA